MNLSIIWRIITTPKCWIRNAKTSNGVDTFFKAIVLNKRYVTVEEVDCYRMTVNFGNAYYRFWISNFPYSCLTDLEQVEKYNFSNGDFYFKSVSQSRSRAMPSRATVFEFFDAYKKFLKDSHKEPEFIEEFYDSFQHMPKAYPNITDDIVDKSKLN